MGFRVQGSGFRVYDSGFRVQGLTFRVEGLGFRTQGGGVKVVGKGIIVIELGGSVTRAEKNTVFHGCKRLVKCERFMVVYVYQRRAL